VKKCLSRRRKGAEEGREAVNQKSAKFSGGGWVARANEPVGPLPGAVPGTNLSRAAPRPMSVEVVCTDRETGETLMMVGRDSRAGGRGGFGIKPKRRKGFPPEVVASLRGEYSADERLWTYCRRRAVDLGVTTQCVYFVMTNVSYKDPAWECPRRGIVRLDAAAGG